MGGSPVHLLKDIRKEMIGFPVHLITDIRREMGGSPVHLLRDVRREMGRSPVEKVDTEIDEYSYNLILYLVYH